MRPATAVLVLTVALALAATASAQVPAGGEFVVNTYTTGGQSSGRSHSIAVLPSGDFVVVWGKSLFPVTEIYGQVFDRAGARLGAEFRVNTYTTHVQNYPLVAALGKNGFVVVWTSEFQDGWGLGVFGQRYDATGARRGGEFQVNQQTLRDQVPYGIAGLDADAFVVVWSSRYQPGIDSNVFARTFGYTGAPSTGDIQVNVHTTRAQSSPSVAFLRFGDYVVVWEGADDQDGSGYGVFGRRFDFVGNPMGGEFQINQFTPGHQAGPTVATDKARNFIVAWHSELQDGSGYGVYSRRFDAAGAAIGGEFQVNVDTVDLQTGPVVSADEPGNFVVAFESRVGTAREVRARRFMADATPISGDFRVNTYTGGMFGINRGSVALDAAGNFIVDWNVQGPAGDYDVRAQRYGGLHPEALRVDPLGNGILEPGDGSVTLRTSWANSSGAAQTFTGQLSNPLGPWPGTEPIIGAAQAIYPTVADGGTGECTSCYAVAIPNTRPNVHWDDSVDERILPMILGQNKRWTLHVGESFTDVPKTNPFYRFVETLLHRGVTGGCGTTNYCPGASTTRAQMAVFTLVAKENELYHPPECSATPMFPDVPSSSFYCPWIEELARRGVVGGCGGGNYCPGSAVTREQVAVFVLRTLDPALNPQACTTPMYNDVPASSSFCRWIEELTRRNVVTGCGGGNYCPAAPVTREQMAVFITVTFGLTLYGP